MTIIHVPTHTCVYTCCKYNIHVHTSIRTLTYFIPVHERIMYMHIHVHICIYNVHALCMRMCTYYVMYMCVLYMHAPAYVCTTCTCTYTCTHTSMHYLCNTNGTQDACLYSQQIYCHGHLPPSSSLRFLV